MQYSDQELIDRVAAGDLRAVARLITLSENREPRAFKVQAELFKKTGRAHVIGITGSPGAGKSTLVDALASEWRKAGKKVAIIAIDPTSPFSGGAILGDRIRMSRIAEDPEVFIRSMATRGSLGGVSRATLDAVHILDAAGFDIVLVETVGVGQAEVDIVRTADTCVVVLVPGMGDSVQAIKAGILEIADLFIINKADREGADSLHKDIRVLLSLSEDKPGSWKPPIVQTVATETKGIDGMIKALSEHAAWLASSPQGKEKRLQILEHSIRQIAEELLAEQIFERSRPELKKLVQRCLERSSDPHSAANELISAARR
ncbi:MAG: methylmalonyl Co-A mutase-associated GTPase MeaB [Deltaproteobacteria bacterium]|nr:methylmalonyl Co-A mutase-associated GTPase MeaB [Deltaproteobacteria bacterium]